MEDGERPGVRAGAVCVVLLTGLVGQIEHLAALFVASGVVFGAAMVGVGRQILPAATEARRNETRGSVLRSAR